MALIHFQIQAHERMQLTVQHQLVQLTAEQRVLIHRVPRKDQSLRRVRSTRSTTETIGPLLFLRGRRWERKKR